MDVIALFLPRRCAICRLPGVAVCRDCLASLVRVRPPVCERCGAPGPWPVRRCAECAGRRIGFAQARAALVYDDRARAFVRAWKERGRRDLARVAAELVASVWPAPLGVLVPVPGERERVLRRGHVPAAGLARELGVLWQLPVEPLLDRPGRSRRQAGLPLVERRRNVRDTFRAVGRAPPRVVVVDDVYTSGSTAAACATILRRAGARRVEVVTLARAVR